MSEESDKPQKVLKPLQVWKKGVTSRYNILSVHLLDWPTLTLEVLKGTRPLEDDMVGVRVLHGTDTNNGEECVEQDYVYLTDIPLPSMGKKVDLSTYSEETGEAGGTGLLPRHVCRPAVFHKLIHDTEVNVARACPLNPDLIATRGSKETVNVFNRAKQPGLRGVVTAVDNFRPDRVFATAAEGWGLCFDNQTLYTGDSAGCLAAWDVVSAPERATMYEVRTALNDLKPASTVGGLLIAACEDGSTRVYDARALGQEAVRCVHTAPVNAATFSCFDARACFAAAGDGTLLAYDLRAPGKALASVQAHEGACAFCVASPSDAGVVATGGEDGLVRLWRVGPGLETLFTHDGHTAPITGLAFSPDMPGLVCSASEDHTIMTWQARLSV